MSDYFVEDGSFINSIVGEGTRFRGELDLNGLLRIDGDYSGLIRTPDKVLVGRNGRAECAIFAGTIVIGGVVKGDIFASEKIIILTTGMVIGNIMTPRLIVEEGVILDGSCRILKDIDIDKLEREYTEKQSLREQEYREASGSQNIDYSRFSGNGTENAETAFPAEQTEKTESSDVSQNSEEKKITAWNG